MTDEYRSDLAAAQARIAELEGRHHAMQMLVIFGMVTSALITRIGRAEGLKAVALSEQLLAAEQALEAESEDAAASDRALRR